MKLSRLLLTISLVVVGFWLLGVVFRFTAWILSGLLSVAAIVIVIWLISVFIEQRKTPKP